jgi:hypothetical protein
MVDTGMNEFGIRTRKESNFCVEQWKGVYLLDKDAFYSKDCFIHANFCVEQWKGVYLLDKDAFYSKDCFIHAKSAR